MHGEVVVLANSPGELSGWVAPVVEELRAVMPEVRITVALIPDWFTSGREQQFAAQLPVDRVVGVFSLIGELWKQRGKTAPAGRVVLFLGGDALYAKLLAWLMRCPAMAYMPRVYRPADFVRIFVPTQAEKERAVKKGAEPAKIVVVPTLALDSIRPSAPIPELRQRFGLSDEARPVFSLLPGSRPEYAALGFQFMLDVAEILMAEFPSCSVLLPVSPFLDRAIVPDVLRQRKMSWRESEAGNILTTGLDGRVRFIFENNHDALAVTDIATVIPGTNNLQCAALGVPFIVLVPLNWIELIPFEGLLGFLYPKFFPFNHLKKYVVTWVSKRMRFTSMVNRMADRMLATEIRAVITPPMVAGAISELWRDTPRRTRLAADLLELTRERGAARIIAEAINENIISDQRLR